MITLQTMDVSDFFGGFGEEINANYDKYYLDEMNVKIGWPSFAGDLVKILAIDPIKEEFAQAKIELQQFLDKRCLNFEQVYRGDKCYTEIFAYEIAKFKLDSNGNKVHLQSFYLPWLTEHYETPGYDVSVAPDVSYYDTQVFYGQEYIYEIFTLSLVIGSQYKLERAGARVQIHPVSQWEDNGEPVAADQSLVTLAPLKDEVVPQTQPKAMIVRAPYYNTYSIENNAQASTIIDKPPLPPDITFYPYKDNANKILALLSFNYGEEELKPIQVFSSDAERIALYKESQKNLPKKTVGPLSKKVVIYKTDDIAGKYEIYRLATKPTNWSDFANADLTTLNVSEQSGFNDFISPNVDYYYFARLVDVHDNFSNPTSVYHIRIVKEEGFPPYLISEIFHFKESKAVTQKSFQKYLKISLADGVRELIKGETIDDSTLGYKKITNGDTIKKYKIRVTSKKTGKKIDININSIKKTVNDNYLQDKLIDSGLPDGCN